MSTTIDKKIVEMRFNNADFERNAAKSMNTVDKLKKSLQFENSDAALDRIAKSVEALERRFSTLGIVGKRVIENITDSVIGLEKRFTSFVVNGVKSGGISRAMNLENARFTMQGLLKDETKVSKVMDAVSSSVDGTAYSLDQAATIAAQFVASGKQAYEIEGALKGVAGAAAVTNSDFSSMGRIFAQVAGQGRLMGNDLLQLSTRGLNAAATMADFFNAINSGDESVANVSDEVKAMVKDITAGANQTEATVRDLVSKSKVSFDIFAASMNNAFADQAAKANDTFTGSLSNIKAALGRIGAEFVSPLIKQQGPFVKLFNTIREKINDVKKVLTTDKNKGNFLSPAATFVNAVTKAIEGLEAKIKGLNINKIIRPLYNIQFSISNIFRAIKKVLGIGKDAFNDVFPKASIGKTITNLTTKLVKFTDKLTPSAETSDKLRRIFVGLFSVIRTGIGAMKAFVKIIGPDIAAAFKTGLSITLEFAARIADFFGKVAGWVHEGKTFERIFTTLHKVIHGLTDVIKPVTGIFKSVFHTLGGLVSKFFETFAKVDFKTAIIELFSSIGTIIKNNWSRPFIFIKNEMASLARFLDNWLSDLDIYKNIKSFLVKVKDTIVDSSIFQFILNAFTKLKDGIASIINSFRDVDTSGAGDMDKKLKNEFTWVDRIGSFLKKAGEVILTVGKFVWNAIKTVGTWIYEAIKNSGLGKAVVNVINNSDLMDVGFGAAGGALAMVFWELYRIFKSGSEIIDGIGKITGNFAKILGDVHDTLAAFQKTLKAEAIMKIAKAVAILAGSLFVLAIIPGDSLAKGVVAITVLMENLSRVMTTFGKLAKTSEGGSKDIKGGLAGFLQNLGNSALSIGGQMLLFAGAIATLTIALGVLGSMNAETLVQGIVMVTLLIEVLTKAVTNISKAGTKGPKAAAIIAALAVSVNLMIAPLLALGFLSVLSPTALGAIVTGLGWMAALVSLIVLEIGGLIDAVTRYGNGFNTGKAKSVAILMGLMAGLLQLITADILVLALATSNITVETEYASGKIGGGAGGLMAASAGLFIILSAVFGFIFGLLGIVKDIRADTLAKKTAQITKIVKMAVATIAAITGLLLVLEIATGEINVTTEHVSTKVGGTGRLESGAKAITMVLTGLLIFIVAMLAVINKINKSRIGKKGKSITDDLKNVAIFVAGAAIAIGLIASAITEMSKKVDIKKGWNAVRMIVAIMALITVLAGISAIPFVQKGLTTLATVFVVFAIAALGFAAAVYVIVSAFKLLSDASKEKINEIGDNMSALADQIAATAPKWANAIAILIASVIQMAVETIALGWKNIIVTVIDMLYQTFDALDGQMPMIVSRITALLVETIDALIPNLGIIVDRIVALVIGLINAVARAIDNHRSEILKAVGRLFSAIGKLIAEAVGRFIGKTGAELEEFVNTWGPRFKKLAELFAAIFVTTKAIGGIKKLVAAVKTAYGAIKTFGGTVGDIVKIFKEAKATGFSTFDSLHYAILETNSGPLKGLMNGVAKLAGMFGGHGILVAGIATFAISAATYFAQVVDEMDVISETERNKIEALERVAEQREEHIKQIKEETEAFAKDVKRISNSMFSKSESEALGYVDDLKEIVDEHGRIKRGMEDEAEVLVTKLNPIFDDNLAIEDGIITLNNNRIDSYKELEAEIDNYLTKLKGQRAMEKYESSYEDWSTQAEEAIGKISNLEGDISEKQGQFDVLNPLYETLDTLREHDLAEVLFGQHYNSLIRQLTDAGYDDIVKTLKDKRAEMQTFISQTRSEFDASNLSDLDILRTFESAYGDWGSDLEDFKGVGDLIVDLNEQLNGTEDKSGLVSDLENLNSELESQTRALNDASRQMNNYDALADAMAHNDYARIEEATVKLRSNLKDRTNATVEELKEQLDQEIKNAEDIVRLNKEKNVQISNDNIDTAIRNIKISRDEYLAMSGLTEAEKEAKVKSTQATIDALSDLRVELNTAKQELDDYAESGKKLSDVYSNDQIKNLKKNLKEAGISTDDITSNMGMDKLKSILGDDYYDLGKYIAEGMANGISDNGYLASDAMHHDVDEPMSNTVTTDNLVASPSKLYYKYGKFIVMGLANGIRDNATMAMQAMSILSATTLSGLTSALANQGKVSVKPIVDLSAIQNGSVQGLLNGESLALSSNVSSQIAASINSAQFDAQMDKISDQLSAMHRDMITIANNNAQGLNNLGKSIHGMQVVMNTGALVGQIAAPIDSALGGIAAIKNRG